MEIKQIFRDKFIELRKQKKTISFVTDELHKTGASDQEINELILVEFKINGRSWGKT